MNLTEKFLGLKTEQVLKELEADGLAVKILNYDDDSNNFVMTTSFYSESVLKELTIFIENGLVKSIQLMDIN